jgi:hypothetical protein
MVDPIPFLRGGWVDVGLEFVRAVCRAVMMSSVPSPTKLYVLCSTYYCVAEELNQRHFKNTLAPSIQTRSALLWR